MKKTMLALLVALVASFTAISVLSCAQDEGDDGTYSLISKLSNPEISAAVYPGVTLVTWKEVTDAGSYKLYRTVNGQETAITTTNDTFYYDKDVYLAETKYTYRVIAVPADSTFHNSGESKITVTTPAEDKFAPAGTTFAELAKYEPNYNSTAPVLDSSTITYRAISADNGGILVIFPVKAYATYTVTLTNDDTRPVSIEDSETISPLYNDQSAYCTLQPESLGDKLITIIATPRSEIYAASAYKRTYTDFKISTPANLVAKDFPSSNTVRLSWDAVPMAETYKVLVNTRNDYKTARVISNITEPYYNYEYEQDGTYYFWVSAVNNTQGAESAYTTAVNCSVTFTVLAPTTLTATSDNTAIYLNWDKSNGTSYTLLYNTTNSSATAKQLAAELTDTSYTWLYPDTGSYYFWVRSVSGTKRSDLTAAENVCSFTLTLAAPENLTAAYSTTDDKVTLSWSTTTCSHYQLYASTTNAFSSATKIAEKDDITINVANTKATYSYLPADAGTWYYWVAAASVTGNTHTVTEESVNCIYTLTTPTDLVATVSGSSIAFTWTPTNSNTYKLYYSTTNDSTALTAANVLASGEKITIKTTSYYSNTKTASYTWSKPDAGTYYFWVTAVSTSGNTESEFAARPATATITSDTNTSGSDTSSGTIVVPDGATVLYRQDFESVTDVATVATSPNAAEYLTIATDKTNYIKFVNNQEKASDRSMYLTEALKVPESGAYIIEFDAALNGLHSKKRFSQLALLTGDEPKKNGTTANVVYKDNFLLTLTCGSGTGGSGGTWVINTTKANDADNNLVEDVDGSVTLTNEAWNHYVINVDGSKVTLTISGTDTLDTKTLTLPANTGAPKWFYFNGAGYGDSGGGAIWLDNIVVYTTDDSGTHYADTTGNPFAGHSWQLDDTTLAFSDDTLTIGAFTYDYTYDTSTRILSYTLKSATNGESSISSIEEWNAYVDAQTNWPDNYKTFQKEIGAMNYAAKAVYQCALSESELTLTPYFDGSIPSLGNEFKYSTDDSNYLKYKVDGSMTIKSEGTEYKVYLPKVEWDTKCTFTCTLFTEAGAVVDTIEGQCIPDEATGTTGCSLKLIFSNLPSVITGFKTFASYTLSQQARTKTYTKVN